MRMIICTFPMYTKTDTVASRDPGGAPIYNVRMLITYALEKA